MSKIYEPRLTVPSEDNKYYVNYKFGGYNTAIIVNANNGFVMPNCVGYSQGRILENMKAAGVDWQSAGLFAGDPISWIEAAKNTSFVVSQYPELGGSIIWDSGHVNTIEKINKDGSIVTSNSGYNSYMFRTETVGSDLTRYGSHVKAIINLPCKFVDEGAEQKTFKVQLGAYKRSDYCISFAKTVKVDLRKIYGSNMPVIIKYFKPWYKIQTGAFSVKQNAINMRDKIRSYNQSLYDGAYITDEEGGVDYMII